MFIENAVHWGSNRIFNYYASDTVTDLLDPSMNTNGVIIRTMCLGIGGQIYIDTSAPSGYGDFTKNSLYWTDQGGGSTPQQNFPGLLPYSLVIPAGLGIWIAVIDGANPYFEMTWDPVTG